MLVDYLKPTNTYGAA